MIEKFIFFPKKNNELISSQWKSSEVAWNINGQKLQGWFVKGNDYLNHPITVYYGGNAEDVSQQLEDLDSQEEMSYLLMNYRGFGGSTGDPTEESLFSDALALYDHLLEAYHIPPENICLVGRSIGSSIAAYVASKRNVQKLVLITPFDSVINVVPEAYQIFPFKNRLKEIFHTAKYLEGVKAQFLVLWAEEDEIIPKKCLTNLSEKFGNQMHLVNVDKANHQDIHLFPEYREAIEAYLKGDRS